jgi:hypothetical protein
VKTTATVLVGIVLATTWFMIGLAHLILAALWMAVAITWLGIAIFNHLWFRHERSVASAPPGVRRLAPARRLILRIHAPQRRQKQPGQGNTRGHVWMPSGKQERGPRRSSGDG